MNRHSITRTLRALTHASVLALATTAACMPAAWAASPEQIQDLRTFKTIRELRGDTAVPVKFVMSMASGASERRQEGQTQGALVSADGLILVPGRVVSLDLGAFARSAGIGASGSSAPSAKSTQFRVRLPGSDEWVPADLVTRDNELGIAWLRLRHPKGKLSWVDFGNPAKVAPGTQLFTVMRTSDAYGAVPIVRVGYVLGETSIPRHEWLVDGVPGIAFDADGNPAGFVDVDLAATMRARSASSGIGMDMADAVFTLIPADRIGRATARAAVLPVVASTDGDDDTPTAPAGKDRVQAPAKASAAQPERSPATPVVPSK